MEPESFYRGGQANKLMIFFPLGKSPWAKCSGLVTYFDHISGHTINYFLFLGIHIFFLCDNNLNSGWFLLICARPSAREIVTQFVTI